MSPATARQQHSPRLHVVKNDLSLSAAGLIASQGSADLLVVPAIIVPTIIVRTRATPMQLRRFWRMVFNGWVRRKRVHMPDGTTRSALMMVVGVVGLLDNMRYDGSLAGRQEFWSIDQLAEFMNMSRTVTIDTLNAMEKWGALYVEQRHDERGHRLIAERSMRIPARFQAQVQAADRKMDLGIDQEPMGLGLKLVRPKSEKGGP